MMIQDESMVSSFDSQRHCPSLSTSFASGGILTPSPSSSSSYERRHSLMSWSEESGVSGYSFGTSRQSSRLATPVEGEEEAYVMVDFDEAEAYHFGEPIIQGTLSQSQMESIALHGEDPFKHTISPYKVPAEPTNFPSHFGLVHLELDGATASSSTIDPALTSVFDTYSDLSSIENTPISTSFATSDIGYTPLTPLEFCTPSETYTGQTGIGEMMSKVEDRFNPTAPSLFDDVFASGGNLNDSLQCSELTPPTSLNHTSSRRTSSRNVRSRRSTKQSHNIRIRQDRDKCRRVDLEELVIIPDSGAAKPHKCKLKINGRDCHARFKRAEHLKRHLRIKAHSAETPFQCHGCGRSFGRSDNFAQHKRTHMQQGKSGNRYIPNFVFDP